MAVKTLYFKNVTVNAALSLQDGGTAPTGAITATGWTVAKLATPNFNLMAVGTEKASGTFNTSDQLTTPSFSAASCWRSENPFTGTFANTNWSLAFRIRAASAAASQTGAVKVRIWKSANADGTGATQLTSAILTGTTTAALSTSASGTSTVTWSPGSTPSFLNEYLWVQCEWSIVATSSSNSADALFYVESAGAITTSDFTASIAGTLTTTDSPDIAAVDGGIYGNGILAVAEATDDADFGGEVITYPEITGVLAVNEDWSPRRPILLLHADGAAGSVTFPDDSGNAHSVTPQGAAQVDSAQSKFGGASAMFAAPADFLTLDGASDFAIGAGDFTVDCFARFNAFDNFNLIDWGGGGPKLTIGTDGKLVYAIGGATKITGTTALGLNTQYHVAVSRAVGVTRLFLDGVQEGSDYVGSESISIGASRPTIGDRV